MESNLWSSHSRVNDITVRHDSYSKVVVIVNGYPMSVFDDSWLSVVSKKQLIEYAHDLIQHINWVIKIGEVLKADPSHIAHHDASKWSGEEFPQYAAYFFGNRTKKVIDAWQLAWLHHENFNPHHWSHWISRSGARAGTAVRMPRRYVVEMICDWHAAGRRITGKWDMSQWVNDNFHDMNMHPATKRDVIKIMESIGYSYKADSEMFYVVDQLIIED